MLIPPEFVWLQQNGNVTDLEMHRTFNMGLGMVLAVSKDASEGILNVLAAKNSGAQIIGHVHDGGHKVTHVNAEVMFQHY